VREFNALGTTRRTARVNDAENIIGVYCRKLVVYPFCANLVGKGVVASSEKIVPVNSIVGEERIVIDADDFGEIL
jgi:hypothetical protein